VGLAASCGEAFSFVSVMRRLLALTSIVGLPAVMMAVSPQVSSSSSSRPPKIETVHATFATSSSATTVRRGARVSLYVDVVPKPNVHIYAPGEKENLPIALTIPHDRAYRIGIPKLPPAQTYVFPPLKLTQLVYSQPFRITQPVTIMNPPPTGTLTITGTIRYQACDDKVCYVPKSVDVSWTIGNR
jgi:hypothetical protein